MKNNSILDHHKKEVIVIEMMEYRIIFKEMINITIKMIGWE